jgi:undecaprenyl-diphosphatase
MYRLILLSTLAAAVGLLCPQSAQAGGGPFGIDHLVAYDNSGIWKRSNQTLLIDGTILTVIGGSLILGDQDGLGDTFWRSLDAMAISGAIAQGGKLIFQRERPSQTSDPNRFFKGTRYQSFPSGEVAAIAGAVTPSWPNMVATIPPSTRWNCFRCTTQSRG